MVGSDQGLWTGVQRLRWFSLVLAVVSMVISDFAAFSSDLPVYGTPQHGVVLGLRALCALCWPSWDLMKHLLSRTRFLEYFSGAVLPFYILHQPVLVRVGYLVIQRAIPSVPKRLVVLAASPS